MINATSGAISGSQGAAVARGMTQELDRDVFLRLLVTQLQTQDPLRPMEDKEFISQLAQFSTLEQMQAMNRSLELFIKSQSSFAVLGLIGRNVEWIDPSTGDKLTGKVESIQFGGDVPVMKVGDQEVPMNMVLSVS